MYIHVCTHTHTHTYRQTHITIMLKHYISICINVHILKIIKKIDKIARRKKKNIERSLKKTAQANQKYLHKLNCSIGSTSSKPHFQLNGNCSSKRRMLTKHTTNQSKLSEGKSNTQLRQHIKEAHKSYANAYICPTIIPNFN